MKEKKKPEPAITFKNDPNTGIWVRSDKEIIRETVEEIEKERGIIPKHNNKSFNLMG